MLSCLTHSPTSCDFIAVHSKTKASYHHVPSEENTEFWPPSLQILSINGIVFFNFLEVCKCESTDFIKSVKKWFSTATWMEVKDFKSRTHHHPLKKDEVKIKFDVSACIWEASEDLYNPTRDILFI